MPRQALDFLAVGTASQRIVARSADDGLDGRLCLFLGRRIVLLVLRTGLLRDKLRRRYRPIDEAEGFDASDDIGAVAIGPPVGNQEGAIGQLYNGIIRPMAAEDGRVVAGTAVDNIVASAAG